MTTKIVKKKSAKKKVSKKKAAKAEYPNIHNIALTTQELLAAIFYAGSVCNRCDGEGDAYRSAEHFLRTVMSERRWHERRGRAPTVEDWDFDANKRIKEEEENSWKECL